MIEEAICNILSRAALCFSHKTTEPNGLPPQQQPVLKARTLSINRRSFPVCCCDNDTVEDTVRYKTKHVNSIDLVIIESMFLPSNATSSNILKRTR